MTKLMAVSVFETQRESESDKPQTINGVIVKLHDEEELLRLDEREKGLFPNIFIEK